MKPPMLSAREALDCILAAARPLGNVTVSLERSPGCVCAADVIAAENVPSFDNAAMDGIAVRSSDVASPPALLRVTGEVAAGGPADDMLQPGGAIRIMTGAQVPGG